MNPYVIAVAALAIIVAYVAGRFEGASLAEASQTKAELYATKAADAAGKKSAEAAVEAIGKIRMTNTTIHQEVRREIERIPVYRDCVHPPGVRERIDAALTGATRPDPAAAPRVPAADPAP